MTVIGGMIIASFTAILANNMNVEDINTTQSRMTTVSNALDQYLAVNGAYPCPASLTAPVSSANYGVQSDAGDCYDTPSIHGTPLPANTGTFRLSSVSGAGSQIRVGAVPVRTLNLPDEYMDDAWGNRFYYAVTEILAAASNANALTTGTPLYNPTLGDVTIDGGLYPTISNAHYAITSAGADRIGAYTADAGNGVQCTNGHNAFEIENCAFTFSATAVGQFSIRQLTGENVSNADFYDDIVNYHTPDTQSQNFVQRTMPSGIITPFYASVCPSGWMAAPSGGLPPVISSIQGLPGGYLYCQKQ